MKGWMKAAAGAAAMTVATAGAQTPTAPVAAVAADAPIPVEAFAALPTLESPTLSPDGTRVAAKMAIRGKQILVVIPLHGKDAKPLMMGASAALDVNWWRWVGNDWLAVGVGAQDLIYGEEVYVTRTLGLSADMKKVNRIGWDKSGIRADTVLWTARDGTPRILLSRQTGIHAIEQFYPEVSEVDLSTGRMRRVAAGQANVFSWFADGAGNVRMGYRYDDDRRSGALLYRPANDQPFRTIAKAKGNSEDILIPVTFRADGTAIATDDSSGRDAVHEVSLPDLKLGRKLFGSDTYDVDGVVENRAGDDIDGVVLTERRGRIEWFTPEMKKLQADADVAVGAGRTRIVSWSGDRQRLLVEVGSPSQAGALYLWDLKVEQMARFAWQNEQLKGRTLSPVRTVRYAARDGVSIEAVLTLPRGRAPKNLPLIVLPHGGPFARDAESWDWWTQYLAERGYAVIQPNYRGSSGYGRAFAKLGEGQWGLKMQDDLNDAVTFLAKDGIADPKRVCMAGASYGGYAAMRAAQRDGGLYRCAISYAGVSDLAAMQRYDSQFLYGRTRSDWLKKQAPDYRLVSPRFGAAAVSIPLLLMHGKEDKRVPVKQSRFMAEALKAAGKPVEYIEQPLGDHHFTRGEDRLQFLKAMGAFLDRHNPA
jgi:dipeptidyl aminopeptidase/acylaminoacyl peptidase